ncbi:MAG TPA: mechanosensitive ion channel family protein [Sulfurospirillum arcachonense]|nr:mechanosensitive ion channel family protein [Sulfurospirillum arcachonense]HIP44131.1 mechanosensitive ion channel family protein [Sulfurospirillum arcachonense]
MQELLEYTIFDIKATDIIISIGILFIAYFFKLQLTKIILKNIRLVTAKTKTNLDDKLLGIIEPPLKFSVLILGFYFAEQWISIEGFQPIATSIEKTLIVFTIFWTLYRAINEFSYIFTNFSSKFGKNLDEDISNFIIKFLKVIILIIGAMTILDGWGINVGAFVASLGLIGMAFALAAKDTAANLFGSLVIFSDKPFKKGDWILTPDVEGTIESIGIRSTRVRTFAQALVSIPNAVIANSAITNWSLMGKRRIKMRLGLTYSTNAIQMENILNDLRQMLKKHPDVHQDTIMIYFDKFEDSSLSLFCYFFTTTTVWAEYLQVKENINLKMMKIIEDNGASFAFPSQSIYVESMPKNEMI